LPSIPVTAFVVQTPGESSVAMRTSQVALVKPPLEVSTGFEPTRDRKNAAPPDRARSTDVAEPPPELMSTTPPTPDSPSASETGVPVSVV
jgi:hypothetical protein